MRPARDYLHLLGREARNCRHGSVPVEGYNATTPVRLIAFFLALTLSAVPAWSQFGGLRGRVLLASGVPPPTGTAVELSCREGGAVETATDADGIFTLSWNSKAGIGPSPSTRRAGRELSSLSAQSYDGCRVIVPLEGYYVPKPSVALRRASSPLNRGNLVSIWLYPIKPGGASVVSITSFEAPSDAVSAHKRALKELGRAKPDLDKAAAALRKATDAYPKYADAWTQLGRTLVRQGKFDAARDALDKAVAADSGFIEPYPLLAGIALKQQDWPAVVRVADRLLELRPGDTQAHYYLAMGQMGLRQFDAAERSARQVADSPVSDQYPEVFQVLGAVHTLQDRFAAAAASFERYIALRPDSPLAADMRALIAEWRAASKLEADVERDLAPNRLFGALTP